MGLVATGSSNQAIAEALESALALPEPPKRIECFDISHIQGSDAVASMVVWEDGRIKKSDYRKFIIRGEAMPEGAAKSAGILRDDFASMREAVERRYRRLQEEQKPFPSLILIDGGIGQLHAASQALEKLKSESGRSADVEMLIRFVEESQRGVIK